MAEYPYMISNNKIAPIFEKIKTAAKPQRFTIEFLTNMGFPSSNDRAFAQLLKKMGFLSDDGTPTIYYDDLRDAPRSKKSIAQRIRTLYNELFVINTDMNSASESEVKGAISRVTGKEEKEVKRIYSTFKALCNYADFSTAGNERLEIPTMPEEEENLHHDVEKSMSTDFHYNIQIHLPATTDISVYNAIFKSIKDNLFK